MRVPAGRIIWTDMESSRWGRVLYIVMEPPIICENCGSVVFEWRSSAEKVTCPDCGEEIVVKEHYPCPCCGRDDYHTLRVVNNDNFYLDATTGEVNEYNNRVDFVINDCGKNLEKEFSERKMILYDAKKSQDTKRLIVWNSRDDFDPTKPMPQEIIDMFPYDEQQ